MRAALTAIREHLDSRPRSYVLRGLAVAIAAAGGVSTAVALSATTPPAPSTVPAYGTLTAGQFISSPDGHFRLTMQPNGNLVERIPAGRYLWSTRTKAHPGARAVMQVNGNLVVYDTANAAIWSSNSPATGCPRLVLQNDGNLIIYTTKSIWATGNRLRYLRAGSALKPGWSLYSIKPEAYRLTMQRDGNLVLRDASGKPLWSTGTSNHPGAYAAMQTDGNFVVYSPTGQALWSTATNGHPRARLKMPGNGNIEIVLGSTVLWRSHTYHAGNGRSLAPRAPAPVSCPAPPSPPTTTAPTTTVTVPTVVTVPVTTPVPRPAPRPRALRVRLEISWTWDRATTRLRKTKVGTFPYRTRLRVGCRGHGCPRHFILTASGIGSVHRLLRKLSGQRYRAGDRLYITLQAPRYRDERAEIDIRWGLKPRVKLLRP